MVTDDPTEAIREHIQRIVAVCRRFPRDRQRNEVAAYCQRLLAEGVQGPTVSAIERHCLECLFIDVGRGLPSPQAIATYAEAIERGCRELPPAHWPNHVIQTLVWLEKAGIDRQIVNAVDDEVERRLRLGASR
ncbi:MAG TPA: hypothetical protein VFI31_09970 [Pirellulales bacterium]|nr:hypothetical protein [Pirellulales bacterium]